MDKIEKNRLDLAYKKQLCLLNFVLIVGAGSLISLFIGIILKPVEWFNYALAFTIIAIFAYISYSKIDETLKKISLEIKNLHQ